MQFVVWVERIVKGLDLIRHSLVEKQEVIAGGLVLQRLCVPSFPGVLCAEFEFVAAGDLTHVSSHLEAVLRFVVREIVGAGQ